MNRLKYFLPLLMALFIVMPDQLFSQEKKKEKKPREKDFLSLEFGINYSFVLGSYGQTDKNTQKSGYAQNGWVGQLGLNWLGKRGWGLGFQFDVQHNGYKDTAQYINPVGTQYKLGNGGWTNLYVMAGPVLIKDIGKWEVNAKAMFGLIIAQSSNFNVQNPIDQSNVSMNATGFGYGVSFAAGYRFDSHWGLDLNLGYLGGTPKATKSYGAEIVSYQEYKDPNTGTIYYIPVYSAPTKYEIKRTVSTINGGIGVIYHF
ncbi:MAG: hypothetical protein WCK92_08385 [Bacteroidota bacterium]